MKREKVEERELVRVKLLETIRARNRDGEVTEIETKRKQSYTLENKKKGRGRLGEKEKERKKERKMERGREKGN